MTWLNPGRGKSEILPSTHPLTTTVIGSWPKPPWLSSGAHDISGWSIDREWRFHGEELRNKQDEATIISSSATGPNVGLR